MAEYLDNDLNYLVEDHSDTGYFDYFDDDESDWDDQQGDEHGSRLEIANDAMKQNYDTFASEYRNGKDMQGITWEYYCEMRLKMYKNYENSLGPHGDLEQGKTYVVFDGQKPGIYDTWIEAASNVNGFKGAIHQSFKSRKEAESAFQAYLDKTLLSTSFTSSGSKNLSAPSSSSSSSNLKMKFSSSEKIAKLKDALEEIKQQLDSLTFNDDD